MNETPSEQPTPEYHPDFVFGGKRVVSEANWAEYQAAGIENVVEAVMDDEALRKALADLGSKYGLENVLLGDAYDARAARPLHLKPGTGVYAHRSESGDGDKVPPLSRAPRLRLPDGTSVPLRPGVRVEIKRNIRNDIAH